MSSSKSGPVNTLALAGHARLNLVAAAGWAMGNAHGNSAGLVWLRRLKQQQLLRALLERCVYQVDRRPLSLPQPLGQLQQVDAAQHFGGSFNQVTDNPCVEVSA